jgi:hypothetical protein
MKLKLTALLAGTLAAFALPAANATILTGTMTADNDYTVYISTDDSTAGTAFGSDGNWPSNITHSTSLTSGVTNYIHVFARDWGGPQMFIGEFGLSDSLFAFANGSQSLLTNTTDWSGNSTGFGSAYTALQDLGPDGTGPWGNRTGIDDNARYIWVQGSSQCGVNGNDCAYFSARIDYVGGTTPQVPEPGTAALLGIALLGFAVNRRRKHLG